MSELLKGGSSAQAQAGDSNGVHAANGSQFPR